MIEITSSYNPRPNTNCTSFSYRCLKEVKEALAEYFPGKSINDFEWLGNPKERYIRIWIGARADGVDPVIIIRFAPLKNGKK